MQWLRTLGAVLAMAALFAIGWNLYLWLNSQQERSVQSAPLPEDKIKPVNRVRP